MKDVSIIARIKWYINAGKERELTDQERKEIEEIL